MEEDKNLKQINNSNIFNSYKKIKINRIIKLSLLIALTFLIIISFIIYNSRKKLKEIITEKLIEKISQKIERKISYSKISYSFNSFEIDEPVIYEKNSNEVFGKAKKLIIKTDLINTILSKKEINIDQIIANDGEINIIKKGNRWNFSDIIELIPKDTRPISERYFIDRLKFENFNFFIKENTNEILLKNSAFSISHRFKSEIFDIKLKTEAYISLVYGAFFSNINLDTRIHLREAIKKVIINKLNIFDFSYGNIKFELGDIKANLNTIQKDLDLYIEIKNFSGLKNMEITIKAEKEYKKITSNEINFKEPFNTKIYLRLQKDYFYLNLNSDNISFESEIKIRENHHSWKLKTKKISVQSSSKLKNPVIKGNLSEEITLIVKNLIISYESFIMSINDKFIKEDL